MHKKIWVWMTVWFLATMLATAGALPRARPEKAGMDSGRLARLGRVLQECIDRGMAVGIVALLARDGKVVYDEAFGKLDPGRGTPMPRDAIFRIASQTKAVTTTAVLLLLEEGKLLLDEPVAKAIPEFAATSVAVPAEKEPNGYAVVPAKRPITVRDLLTHTAGISYGNGPAREEYKAAGLQGWFLADRPEPVGDLVKKLAKLPLDAQPGERWVYGYNSDILGCLVERLSGLSLADFFASRITGPLGMADTHFFLPEGKLDRFTPVYGAGDDGVLKLVEAAGDNFYVKGPRACFSGGAGLLSTAEDYARFLIMLQQGGELAGVRLLGPKTVELLSADHAGSLYGDGTYGLGFWVVDRLGRNGQPGSPGLYGWGGAYHTYYFVDPVEKLVGVFMTQLLPAGKSDMHGKFRALAYAAITDSYAKR